MRPIRALIIVLSLFSFMTAVPLRPVPSAQAAEDEQEGRKRFRHGEELYRDGKFIEAAHEFELGYAAAPRSLFLLNIGHSYRKAGELTKAKRAYEKLLAAEPNLAQRADVVALVKSIDQSLEPATPALPPPAPVPSDPSLSPANSRLPTPSATSLPPRKSDPALRAFSDEPGVPVERNTAPLWKNPWIWAVAGAVLVAGGVVGVLSMRKGNPCPSSATICFNETGN